MDRVAENNQQQCYTDTGLRNPPSPDVKTLFQLTLDSVPHCLLMVIGQKEI
jgi:hypothetical protein